MNKIELYGKTWEQVTTNYNLEEEEEWWFVINVNQYQLYMNNVIGVMVLVDGNNNQLECFI